MTWDEVLVYCFCIAVIIFWVSFTIKDIKKMRRQPPDGKVFIKEFVETVKDIYDGIVNSRIDKNVDFITSHVNKHTFRVRVEKQAPYDGLEFETIPMYKNYTIYIDDEVVCRVHFIHKDCKDKPFIEFSSKRDRDEVIEILRCAHVVANEINHEWTRQLFSKYNSKSFYQSSED